MAYITETVLSVAYLFNLGLSFPIQQNCKPKYFEDPTKFASCFDSPIYQMTLYTIYTETLSYSNPSVRSNTNLTFDASEELVPSADPSSM